MFKIEINHVILRGKKDFLLVTCCALVLAGCGSSNSGGSEAEANSRGDSEWQQVTIAELSNTGLLTSQIKVEIDSSDNAHFVYFDSYENNEGSDEESRYELKHLVWNMATSELLAGDLPESVVSLDNSADIALAINPDTDSIYTTYRGGGFRECNADIQSDAMFSVKEAGVWNEYTAAIGEVERNPVINDGLAGDDLSIAIDSSGNVHIAYQFFYEGCDAMNSRYPDIKYVRKEAGDFASTAPEQMVEGNDYDNSNDQNNAGSHNVMVLDGDENPVIFYYAELSNGTEGLRVARLQNNQWHKEWVETSCEIGGISAAYSDEEFLGVAYYIVRCDDLDGDNVYETHALRYADNSSGSWAIQTVDDSTKTGKHPSLSFDEDGLPAIAYYQLESYSGRELNNLYLSRFYSYVSPNTDDGLTDSLVNESSEDEPVDVPVISGWRTETVAETGNIGLYNSLWFDLGGKAHISSYSSTAETIYLFNEL